MFGGRLNKTQKCTPNSSIGSGTTHVLTCSISQDVCLTSSALMRLEKEEEPTEAHDKVKSNTFPKKQFLENFRELV